MKRMVVGLVVVVAVAVLGLALFLMNRGQTPTNSGASSSSGSTQTITVEAGSYYFKPATMRVKVGQKVKLVMTSKGMLHDFNIDELGVQVPVTQAGQTATVEFTPSKTGSFEYYCSVSDHRQRGQVGTITVE